MFLHAFSLLFAQYFEANSSSFQRLRNTDNLSRSESVWFLSCTQGMLLEVG